MYKYASVLLIVACSSNVPIDLPEPRDSDILLKPTTYVYMPSSTPPDLMSEVVYAAEQWSQALGQTKLQVVIDDTKPPTVRFLAAARVTWPPGAAGYGVVNAYMDVVVQPILHGAPCSTRGLLLHEFGHFVGVGHTPDDTGIMRYYCYEVPDTLTAEDISYCVSRKQCLPTPHPIVTPEMKKPTSAYRVGY